MAYKFTSNIPFQTAGITFTSNTTLVVAGNNSVSNVALSSPAEVLTGFTITRVFWGADSGYIKLSGDANTLAIFNNSGQADYSAHGLPLTALNTGNLSVTSTATNFYVNLQLRKVF